MPKKSLGAREQAAQDRRLRKQLTIERGARALIAMSIAVGDIDRKTRKHQDTPILSYARALKRLDAWHARFEHNPGYPAPTKTQRALAKKIVDRADEIYNEAIGPDEWSPDVEERALERADNYVEDILRDLGIDR